MNILVTGAAGALVPITVNWFLMNLDEAVELGCFAFMHAKPGNLFIQKVVAPMIGDLSKGGSSCSATPAPTSSKPVTARSCTRL